MEITDEAIEVALRWYFDERGRNNWGLTEDQWRAITRQMRDVLEAAAPRPDGLLFYRGLVEQTDLRDHPAWNLLVAEFLLLLVKACVDSGLPLLTALVYGKASNEPGPGVLRRRPALRAAVSGTFGRRVLVRSDCGGPGSLASDDEPRPAFVNLV